MKRYLGLFKQTWTEFVEDKAQRLGAALAYYTVFSIAPMLLIAVAIAGLAFGKNAAQHQIQHQLGSVLGQGTAEAVEKMIQSAAKPRTGTIATIIGVIILLFGAAGVFGQLQEALDTIWNVERPEKAGFLALITDRFLSMAMVFGIGFLLLVTLVIDAIISAMGHYLQSRIPGGEAVLQVAQLLLSFGLVTLLFAMMFRYLPHTRVEWRDVWFGAAFTSFLFVIGKFALGLYIGKAAVGSAYGAAGSLVVILIWVYWSAQILFFGAEFTQVYARSRGSMAGKAAVPALPAAPAAVKRGGGVGKLVIGGIAGMLLGAIGGVAAIIGVVILGVRRLIRRF